MSDIESRLRAVEDRLAISELRAQYNRQLDSLRFEAFSELFADDAVTAQGEFTVQGRPGIRAAVEAGGAVSEHSWHFVSNEITELDGDRATGSCWFQVTLVIKRKPSVGFGRYEDEYARGDDGTWRFARREVFFLKHYPVADFQKSPAEMAMDDALAPPSSA